jgi:type I restriction enzyme, S subunit
MTYRWFGAQPSRWPVVPIRKVCRLGTGHTPDRSNPDYWREEDCVIPWVTVADIHRLPGLGLTPLQDTEQHISEVGLANSAAVLHPTGTVMVSRTASIGFACRIGRPMATTQAFATWTPGPAVDSRYLLLVAKALAPEFDRLAYGSTHLTIYMPDIEGITMPLPPLATQRAIADYLDHETSRIDALIATKQRMANLLEERRRAVRDYAFDSKPGRRLKYLLANSMAYGVLVPEFVEAGAGIPMIRTYNLSSRGGVSHEDIAEIPAELAREYQRTSLRTGDVILSVVGSMGRSAVASSNEQGYNLNRPLARLQLRPEVPPRLIWHWTQTTHFMDMAKLVTGAGTAQPTLNLGDLANFTVGLPQETDLWPEILTTLEGECARLDETGNALDRQLDLLQERRQALVAAAVAGQFDIQEPT